MPSTIKLQTILRLSLITACACLTLAHAQDPWRKILNAGLKEYFKCPPCERQLCPALSTPGCVPVMEAGVCGCCEVCGRVAGEPCGFKDSICAPGLQCVPTAIGSRAMFQQLSQGQAVCLPMQRKYRFIHIF